MAKGWSGMDVDEKLEAIKEDLDQLFDLIEMLKRKHEESAKTIDNVASLLATVLVRVEKLEKKAKS